MKYAVPEPLELNNIEVPKNLNIRFLSDRMERVAYRCKVEGEKI